MDTRESVATEVREGAHEPASLVSLLGEQRAAIATYLRDNGEATAGELAGVLGVSEVATRRHLGVLDDDGFVTARTVKQGRGRPAAHYRLTDRARNLFPQRYAAMASELIDFIADEHGRAGVREYLRWRLERQVGDLSESVTAEDLHGRLRELAAVLSEAGFDASVTPDGDGFTLTQDHCAIYQVAAEHPEVCAYEAAAFSRVLGSDVSLSRRETLASGSGACVCCVRPKASQRPRNTP